jgi:hypothetical protein
LAFGKGVIAGWHMQRRVFISGIGVATLWPFITRAQGPTRVPTIGFLGSTSPEMASHWMAAFLKRLRELGWIEGRTIAIEYRWADAHSERYSEIAAEFGCYRHMGIRTGARGKAGDHAYPHCIRGADGPRRRWRSCKSGATRRQRDGHVDPANRYRGQAH